MDDLVQAVVDEVLRRQGQRPALLVGRAPQAAAGWRFVTDGPYEAVILGSLTAAELLRFPDEASAQALLEGKPVYYCPEGLDYRRHAKTANRALWSALLAAERRLRALGVQELAQKSALVTAAEARRLLHSGLPVTGRLTPLARDVLEGRAGGPGWCSARCGPRKKAPPSRGRACCACAAARRNTSRRTLSARGRATGSSSPLARRRARGGRTCP